MKKYLCYDIGGSLVKAAVMDQDGNIVERFDINVPSTFDELINDLHHQYLRCQGTYEIEGVAISAPGAVNDIEGVIYGDSALPYIHGPNWKQEWAKFGVNISIENDANCAALGELHYGTGKNKNSLAYIVIGTGVGGAIVIDGQLYKGKNNHAGEYGHMVLYPSLMKSWSHAGAVGGLLLQAKKDGHLVKNGRELFELAKTDTYFASLVDQFYEANALGIFNVQYTIDPELILLGGAISQRADLVDCIYEKLDSILEQCSGTIRPVIEVGSLKDDANLFGALAHYLNENKHQEAFYTKNFE